MSLLYRRGTTGAEKAGYFPKPVYGKTVYFGKMIPAGRRMGYLELWNRGSLAKCGPLTFIAPWTSRAPFCWGSPEDSCWTCLQNVCLRYWRGDIHVLASVPFCLRMPPSSKGWHKDARPEKVNLLPFPTLCTVEINLMCQLDWVTDPQISGYITSGCVCEGIFRRDWHLNQ